MQQLSCERTIDSVSNRSITTTGTSGMRHHSGENGSTTSSDTIQSLAQLAISSGRKDILQQKCQQLLERITHLAESIIDTTTAALNDDAPRSPEPRWISEKSLEPTSCVATTSYAREKSRIGGNSIKRKSNSNSPQTRKRGSNIPIGTPVDTQTNLSYYSRSVRASRSENVFGSHMLQWENSKPSRGDGGPATRPVQNLHSQKLACESLTEVLCSTGTRDARPLFVEERELSAGEVRKTMTLLSQTDHVLYYELFHVQSCEVVPSVPATQTKAAPRVLRDASFTKAIYLHSPTDACTAADANTNTTPGKPLGQGNEDGGKFTPAPAAFPLSGVNAKSNAGGTPQCGEARCDSQYNTHTRARSAPMSATSVSKVRKKDDKNSSIPTPTPIIWHPTFSVLSPNECRRNTLLNEGSTSQERHNSEQNSDRGLNTGDANCSYSNFGCFDDDGGLCIPEEGYNPLFLYSTGRAYTLFFTPPLSYSEKRARSGSLHHRGDVPIEVCVTPVASPVRRF